MIRCKCKCKLPIHLYVPDFNTFKPILVNSAKIWLIDNKIYEYMIL
jgi:hypothetical protein